MDGDDTESSASSVPGDSVSGSSSVEYADTAGLGRDLGELLADEDFGDVRVCEAGGAYTASSAVLKARSEYFRRLLAPAWGQSGAIAANFRPEVFKDVLEYLHSGSVRLDASGRALEVLLAADEMGLTDLVELACKHAYNSTSPECLRYLELGARLGPLPPPAMRFLMCAIMARGKRSRNELAEASAGAVRLAMLVAGESFGLIRSRVLVGIEEWTKRQQASRSNARVKEELVDDTRGAGSSLRDYLWFRLLDDGRAELWHFLRYLPYSWLAALEGRMFPTVRTARDYALTPLWAEDGLKSQDFSVQVWHPIVEWMSTPDGRDLFPIVKSWAVHLPSNVEGVMVSFDHGTQVDGGNIWFSRDQKGEEVYGSLGDFSRKRCVKCFVIQHSTFYVHFELDAGKLFPEVMMRSGLGHMGQTHRIVTRHKIFSLAEIYDW